MAADAEMKPPKRKRWLWRFLWSLLVSFVGFMIATWIRHERIVKRLDEAIAEQDRLDPGWRLHELEEARAYVPPDKNGILQVEQAVALLPKNWTEKLKVKDDDLAVPPNRQLRDDQVLMLMSDLGPLSASRDAAIELDRYETGRYAIRYAPDGVSTLLPHVDNVMQLMHLCSYDAWLSIQQAKVSRAERCCAAILNLGRSIGDEPIAISQLVRMRACEECVAMTERLLAQVSPSRAFIAKLSDVLEQEEAYPRLLIAVKGERAMLHYVLRGFETGRISSLDGFKDYPSWRERLLGVWGRDEIRKHHLELFPIGKQMIQLATVAPHQRAAEAKKFEEMAESCRDTIVGLFLPAINKIEQVDTRVRARMRCMIVGLALERYRQKHDKWPDQLQDLAPATIAKLPTDPFTGGPLLYRRVEDGVIVYSTGADLTDDHGDVVGFNPGSDIETRDGSQSSDVGVRLWDFEHRRLWPVPIGPFDLPGAPPIDPDNPDGF